MVFIWTVANTVTLILMIIFFTFFMIGIFEAADDEFLAGMGFATFVCLVIFLVAGLNQTSTVLSDYRTMKQQDHYYAAKITLKKEELERASSDDYEIVSLELSHLCQQKDDNAKKINKYSKALNKKFKKYEKKHKCDVEIQENAQLNEYIEIYENFQ